MKTCIFNSEVEALNLVRIINEALQLPDDYSDTYSGVAQLSDSQYYVIVDTPEEAYIPLGTTTENDVAAQYVTDSEDTTLYTDNTTYSDADETSVLDGYRTLGDADFLLGDPAGDDTILGETI